MDRPDFDEIARRPLRYWDVDGLPELVMGILWTLWGAAWLFGEALPHDWRWNVYWTAVPVVLAFSGLAAVRVIKSLKSRLTFPRTGYVAWKEPSRGTHLAGAAIAIVTASVLAAVGARGGGDQSRYATPILGVILGLAFVLAGFKQRAPHYLALAGVALALGFALAPIGEGWQGANWLLVGIGAATAVAGGVRLAIFLNRHPRLNVEGA